METEVITTFDDFLKIILSEISFIGNKTQEVIDELKSAQYESNDSRQVISMVEMMKSYQKRIEELIDELNKIRTDLDKDISNGEY